MDRTFYKFFFLSFATFFISCNSNPKKSNQTIKINTVLYGLKKQKGHIDSLASKADVLTVLVKIPRKNALVRVKGDDFPDEIETTYNIYKEPGGMTYIVEIPFSESGDWFIAYKSYFDRSGKLFAFVKETNSFNSECTDGVMHEKLTKYYNNNFRVVDSLYTILDDKKKPLNKSKCIFNYDYPYKVINNLKDYVKANKIKV